MLWNTLYRVWRVHKTSPKGIFDRNYSKPLGPIEGNTLYTNMYIKKKKNIYIYRYIHICCCVQFWGVFVWGLKISHFCLMMERFWNQNIVFSPGVCLFFHLTSADAHPTRSKRGAYVVQHRLPIIERIHAPQFLNTSIAVTFPPS